MAFLDNTGLGTVWGRIKTVFGAGFADLVKDSTSVTIKLQNGYGNDLDTVAIPLADSTNSKAGLMSPTEKSKLAGIASGAEVNVQSNWTQTTTTADDYIKNKPTNLSDFTNDSGFITTADVPSASSTSPKMNGTAAVGTESTYARGDHVHPTDTSRAASSHTHGAITNDGLVSSSSGLGGFKDIAANDHIMLASAGTNKICAANLTFDGSTTTQALTKKGTWATFVQDANYVHTDNNYTSADKTKVGYVDTGKSVSTYVSEQISSAMTGAAKYKGTVGTGGTVTTLPTSGYKQGDYYVVCTAGTYAGNTCEVGDMLFANKDYASGATEKNDWDAVQANITAMTTAEINAICV